MFLDSDAQHLRAGGYIFRVRRPLESEYPEVTLKFRHPDRYVAESRQMKSRRIRTDAKYEEDIKGPFVSLYSFSTTGDMGKKPVPSSLDDVSRLFPDLSTRLGAVDPGQKLSEVGSFTARELVITGATITIGAKPKVVSECALIVWYAHDGSATEPVVVELSYRYGDAKGRYEGDAAKCAADIFEIVQRELTEWVDPNPRTKTASCTDDPPQGPGSQVHHRASRRQPPGRRSPPARGVGGRLRGARAAPLRAGAAGGRPSATGDRPGARLGAG